MPIFRRFVTPRERIEKEINKHEQWCSPNCTSFSPTRYRKARLELGFSHLDLINKKIQCHN
jgi:hypothetical protein